MTNTDSFFDGLEDFEDEVSAKGIPELNDGEFAPIPDGLYQVQVMKVNNMVSQSENKYLNWHLRILEGPHAGQYLFKRSMLNKVDSIRFLLADLRTCGSSAEKIADIEHGAKEVLDVIVEVRKKTSGDFENIYINRKIGKGESADNVDGSGSNGLRKF